MKFASYLHDLIVSSYSYFLKRFLYAYLPNQIFINKEQEYKKQKQKQKEKEKEKEKMIISFY